MHANGLLPTARIGVASRLAALAPDLVERLFTDNAAMFASTATVAELPSDEARVALVKGLLEAAAREDAEPDWRLERTGLILAGLSEHLARGPANAAIPDPHFIGERITKGAFSGGRMPPNG